VLLEHELRVRLRERRNRLYKTDYQAYDNELELMLKWMRDQPYIRALLDEVETAEIDAAEWTAEFLARHSLIFPDAEAKRAKVCLYLADHGDGNHIRVISGESHYNSQIRDFTEIIIDPLVSYLEDRIEEGSAVLGLLLRYQRWVEWFRRAELYGLYDADTGHSENHLDTHLREYLLTNGIDFPFSQPESPSGKADIVAGLGTADPLALEVKLFLPADGKNDAYIRQGFAQAYRYASDYGLAAGYLVVFNLTDVPLVFETTTKRPDSPPLILVGDKTIFLISVWTHPDVPTASRRKSLDRHVIDEAYLLEGIKDSSRADAAGSGPSA
jgi:hypothetical protein